MRFCVPSTRPVSGGSVPRAAAFHAGGRCRSPVQAISPRPLYFPRNGEPGSAFSRAQRFVSRPHPTCSLQSTCSIRRSSACRSRPSRARLHPAPTCNSYDHISHAAADTPHALDDQIEPSSRLRRRASVQECALVDLKSRATCSCRGPSRGAPPWRARSQDSPWHTTASPPSL